MFQSVRDISFCWKYFYIYYLGGGGGSWVTQFYCWACAGLLIFMYGVQSHEVRQENLAEHWTVRGFSNFFFFSHQSRQSSSASRCVSQIENYIKESMKAEMAQLQQSAVHNHTAAMLEMGTNLLSQTAEQTRKLTDVETQVRTLGCFAVVFLLFVFNSGILLQGKWDRDIYSFLALHFQLCDGGWWLFVEVWSGWLVMLCWLLCIIGLFLVVLFLIVWIYCVWKMPLSHFKLLLELKQWID